MTERLALALLIVSDALFECGASACACTAFAVCCTTALPITTCGLASLSIGCGEESVALLGEVMWRIVLEGLVPLRVVRSKDEILFLAGLPLLKEVERLTDPALHPAP